MLNDYQSTCFFCDFCCKKIMKVGNEFDYLLRVIMIGEAGVGKSCMVSQFVDHSMSLSQESTIGIEFATKSLCLQDRMVKLQIWDTAGQENFRSLTRSYYRNVIAALLVYDITKYILSVSPRRDTFEYLHQWINDIENNGNSDIEIVLVGNKNDLNSARRVQFEEGQAFAHQHGLKFYETSATDLQQVEAVFVGLSDAVLQKIQQGKVNRNTSGIKYSEEIKIDSGNFKASKKKKQCC